MNVRNCGKCGRIFNYVSGPPICAKCRKELEEVFKETRGYIRKNPDASIQEVAEECKVEVRQIKQWIREERLSFSKDSDIGIDCERCGKSIKTGRFCEACKKEQVEELKSVSGRNAEPAPAPVKEKTKTEMRFLNRNIDSKRR